MKGAVDLTNYMLNSFQPLDIFGTTDYNPLARIIWKETWYKGKWYWFLIPYVKRAHLCTHIAVSVIGKDKRKWLMEMDVTKMRTRYLKEVDGSIIAPEEWTLLDDGDKCAYKEIQVPSGLLLSEFNKYMPEKIRDRHITWIGRPYGLKTDALRMEANEKMFDLYRKGVEYDYMDLMSFTSLASKYQMHGSKDVFICSELPQRVFEHLGIMPASEQPMSPMQWQLNRNFTYNVRTAEGA